MTSLEPERVANKRPRPVVSCIECRNRKLKCNRCLPCDRCIKDGRQNLCKYAAGREPAQTCSYADEHVSKRRRLSTEAVVDTKALDILAQFSDLQSRVQQLEGALSSRNQQAALTTRASVHRSSDETVTSIHEEPEIQASYSLGQIKPLENALTYFPAAQSFIVSLGRDAISEELTRLARDLRDMEDSLHTRPPSHGSFDVYDNITDVLAHMERMLPPAPACHLLIGHYFDYFEDCCRVLHRGTAWSQFDAYLSGSAGVNHSICVPQILAVVSVASSLGIFPECDHPILHGYDDGIGAYHLLRNYLNLLDTVQWFDFGNIQVATLTLKFHKSCSMNNIETWNWSGQISRRAMTAGLHLHVVDSEMSIFDSEIRKRLWHTILEYELTFAIVGEMPYVSPLTNGSPPLNVDDAQLFPGMLVLPQNKDKESWTNGLCSHVLAESFHDRAVAYQAVSSARVSSYEVILRHTRHIEQIIHDLPSTFRLGPSVEEAADTPHRLMAKMTFDFLMRRPLNACYAPYAKAMPAHDRFRKARIPWIQGCTIGICFQDLYDPLYPTLELPEPMGLWDYFYNVYDWDLQQFMLASCLELQRLQIVNAAQPDVPSPVFQGHALRAPVKVMGWSQDSMMKSLEDTISPLSRRLGRHGSRLQDAVKWITIIESLCIGPLCSRRAAIKNELQKLISSHKRRLLPSSVNESTDARHLSEGMSDLLWLQQYLQNADAVTGGITGE